MEWWISKVNVGKYTVRPMNGMGTMEGIRFWHDSLVTETFGTQTPEGEELQFTNIYPPEV